MGEKIGISAAREVEAHSRERTSTNERVRREPASETHLLRAKANPPRFFYAG